MNDERRVKFKRNPPLESKSTLTKGLLQRLQSLRDQTGLLGNDVSSTLRA